MSYNELDGDLLCCNEQVIIQQLNCLCVRPHGLSASIASKFPYANVYACRRGVGNSNRCVAEDEGRPGSIVVSTPPLFGFGAPIVIGLYGQYDYGRGYGTVRVPKDRDNATLREGWFASALVKLGEYLHKHNIKSVGVPHGIGCGLANGCWEHYQLMLYTFAVDSGITVNVYKKST